MTSAAATATAIAGLLAALLGVLRYFNYKTNRDRTAAVGTAFGTIIDGLSSADEVQRLASAVLLRRFFDPRSEFAVRTLRGRKLPYATAAVNVIAAVLRTEPTGDVQKVLGDGLAFAPTLVGFDLQRTNLRNCYLGKGEVPHMDGMDCFGADLADASFRDSRLRGAVFYGASLVGTVFTNADLRGADFRDADLNGARLDRARLAGGKFKGARNLPPGMAGRLGADRVFGGVETDRFRPDERTDAAPGPPTVFLSTPSVSDSSSCAVENIVVDALQAENATIRRVRPHAYSAGSPFRAVTAEMRGCWGVVVVGVRQMHVMEAELRAGTAHRTVVKDIDLPTPWNQIEAGMAAAMQLPLFVVSACFSQGVFAVGNQGKEVRTVEVGQPWDVGALQKAVRTWLHDLQAPAA